MCTISCLEFVAANLMQEDIRGKAVIEVGAYDVNGSCRSIVQLHSPARYVGVDIEKGPGVDEVCDACDLVARFGPEKYDLLISTEVIEHIRDWRKAISNFKNVLKPNGILVVTTRSKGFWYHGWPCDYWRYEVADLRVIFSDFIIKNVEKDTYLPGVFIKARKPLQFLENDLSGYALYSIIRKKRISHVKNINILLARIKYPFHRVLPRIIPSFVKNFIKNRVRRRFLDST